MRFYFEGDSRRHQMLFRFFTSISFAACGHLTQPILSISRFLMFETERVLEREEWKCFVLLRWFDFSLRSYFFLDRNARITGFYCCCGYAFTPQQIFQLNFICMHKYAVVPIPKMKRPNGTTTKNWIFILKCRTHTANTNSLQSQLMRRLYPTFSFVSLALVSGYSFFDAAMNEIRLFVGSFAHRKKRRPAFVCNAFSRCRRSHSTI